MPIAQRTYILVFCVKIAEYLQFDQKENRIASSMKTHIFLRDLGYPLWYEIRILQ